jgi:hypothetical protein
MLLKNAIKKIPYVRYFQNDENLTGSYLSVVLSNLEGLDPSIALAES